MAGKRKRQSSEIAVNIIACILIVIALAALLPSVFWVYLKTHPDKLPETHVTSYVSTIVDENGEERQFIEVEYWENLDGSGKKVIEISFNAYSGQDATHVRRMGVQYSIDSDATNIFDIIKAFNYTQDGGASWKALGTEVIDVGTPMYLKIGDELISVAMDGTYIEYGYNFNFAKGFTNFFKWAFANEKYKLDINDKSFGYTVTETVKQYTMSDFYTDVFNAVIHNNVGYGSNILSLVDLSKYFTIKKRVGNLNQWESIEKYQEHQNEYFSIKVTRHRDGFYRAKESVFGMYRGDAEFSLVETDTILNDFTSIDDIVTLTYQDFDYKLCEAYGGYIAYINEDTRAALSLGRVEAIAINLDFSSQFFLGADKPVIGIMYDCVNVSNVVLTFNQNTFPIFFEFYDKNVGRQYIPTDAAYKVYNKMNENCGISSFAEVEI